MDDHNPLVPAGYDIAWSVIVAAVIALTVIALIGLARSAKHLTALQAWIWTLLVLLVPVLGAVAWLAVGRRSVLPANSRQS
ncbi:PLDc N-terminal domain-containing protein [Microbacterium excoecariae]|uniref:PLDc N-terminal domain-containing protein n=1 Tax=Microbacterium excoecariae TaxID=2715210 RepID=UPI001407E7DF|nr:PLDc N-terminal domain-containing protein [Microbacterium excoecariae]NHI15975.1 hypothetical protein [Microbacterium excoecariae]